MCNSVGSLWTGTAECAGDIWQESVDRNGKMLRMRLFVSKIVEKPQKEMEKMHIFEKNSQKSLFFLSVMLYNLLML